MTSDHCRVTVQRLFSKIFLIDWNVQKRCLTVGRRSRDLRPQSRDRSVTFHKNFPNCLKRRKNVVWQSADGCVTSNHCRVTIQWLFSKNFLTAWNFQKTLFDSRPTVGDLRPLSRDRSVTFSKILLIAWNVEKTLFDSRPTVAWPTTTVAWPFSDFFQKFSWLLETSKKRCLKVSARSRDCPATLLSCFFRTASTYAASRMYLSLLLILSAEQVSIRYILITWLLLEEKANPGFYDIKWKIFSGKREILILVGKFPLADFPGGKQIPLFKARPRISSYRNNSIQGILTSYQSQGQVEENFWFWWENSNSLIPYEGNKFPIINISDVA